METGVIISQQRKYKMQKTKLKETAVPRHLPASTPKISHRTNEIPAIEKHEGLFNYSSKPNIDLKCSNVLNQKGITLHTITVDPQIEVLHERTQHDVFAAMVYSMHKTIVNIVANVKTQITYYHRTIASQPRNSKCTIDLPALIELVRSQCQQKVKSASLLKKHNQEIIPYSVNSYAIYINKNNYIKIYFNQSYVSLIINVNKYKSVSMDLMKSLSYIHGQCRLKVKKPVPSVVIRDWQIKNIIQGYLLSIFLRNCNVASLNVMRNLYFVIITTNTPNLTIEFNFKLSNGIFMAYDAKSPIISPFNLICFNEEHRKVLSERNMPPIVFNENNIKNENDVQQLSIGFVNVTTEDSSSTLKKDDASVSDESDNYFNSLSCSESEYFELQSSDSVFSPRESIHTIHTLTLSLDKCSSLYRLPVRKDCGDLNLTTIHPIIGKKSCHDPSLGHGKSLLAKILDGTMCLKQNINLSDLNVNTLLNESLFDFASLTDYFDNIYRYIDESPFGAFYSAFAMGLSRYLVHTFFSTNVPSIF